MNTTLTELLSAADALQRSGNLPAAIHAYEQLTRDNPDVAAIHNNLGVACKEAGRIEQAIVALSRAVLLAPNSPQTWNNLGNVLRLGGSLDPAIDAYRAAQSLAPQHIPVLNNLATALHEAGRLYEAIDLLREAIAIDPRHASVHSNLLYQLHFDPRLNANEIRGEHEIWNERHARRLREQILFPNDRDSNRPLRVGIVSSHYTDAHVIGRFMAWQHKRHASQISEIRIYSHDREFNGIRENQTDILIDLDMHLAAGHPLLFARKLAPVQVTYLGYVAGAGLESIHYRLSDPYLDPSGWESNYIEKTVRLPTSYWCYRPVEAPLQDMKVGGITFGSLNNFAKTLPAALPVWGEILRRVPASRLILSSPAPSTDQLAIDTLKVDPARLTFVRFQKIEDYLKLYNTIDVALDPFPYAGGTTTCDALYMGVPVVTLAGKTSVGRGGVSILSNLGLHHLIAETIEQYIDIAASVPRVPFLRSRMMASPLVDADRFVTEFESALRQMWRHWCASAISDSRG